MTPADIYSE